MENKKWYFAYRDTTKETSFGKSEWTEMHHLIKSELVIFVSKMIEARYLSGLEIQKPYEIFLQDFLRFNHFHHHPSVKQLTEDKQLMIKGDSVIVLFHSMDEMFEFLEEFKLLCEQNEHLLHSS